MTISFKLSSLNGKNGFRVDGVDAGDYAGISVSSAGDVNHDGIDDLIVGANLADPNGNVSGEAYVVFGHKGNFSASLDLKALDGKDGFTLTGSAEADLAGFSVSNAGDVNKDGKDDFIVGAFGVDSSGTDAGSAYLVYGTDGGFPDTLNLNDVGGSIGFRINGVAAGDFAGISVASAGDVNGDGIDDVLIGASAVKNASAQVTGGAYVVFGKANFGDVVNLSSLNGNNGFRMTGAVGDSAGTRVAGGGDFNGDGIVDLIIGAYTAGSNAGKAYVVFGRASGFTASLDLTNMPAARGFSISGTSIQQLGKSVASAGDINGDGIDDIVIGAPRTDTGDPVGFEGAAYVIFGKTASFGANFNLATLNGNNGFRLKGAQTGSYTGMSVAGAGDVNGDGFDDLLVGAYKMDAPTSDSGAVYLVFGKASGFDASINLADLKWPQGFRIDAEAPNDRLGFGLKAASDINGDGFDDIVIGGYRADPNFPTGGSNANEGAAYVIFGRANIVLAPAIELAKLEAKEGFRVNGVASDQLGYNISAAGDVNGDGIADILMSARNLNPDDKGKCYIVFGKSGNLPLDIAVGSLNGTNGFGIDGVAAGDHLATSVAAGDINGDGIDDFILGASYASNTGSYRGVTYVVFGQDEPFAANFNLATLDGTNGFRLNGTANGDYSGVSLAAADINGDGFEDVIVGASGRDTLGDYSGAAYVVLGKGTPFAPALNLNNLNGNNGFRLDGEQAGSFSGVDVAAAGDVNGDGFEDFLIGAPQFKFGGGEGQGAAYLVFGKASGFNAISSLSGVNGTTGFRFRGINDNDYSGLSVSGIGDFNGDGVDDLIISAHAADRNGNDSGSSYVVFGGVGNLAALDAADGTSNGTISLSKLNAARGFRIDGVATNDYQGYSVGNAGDVNGDGFDDLIVGAYRAAVNGVSTGSAYVVYGKAAGFTPVLQLSTLDGVNGFRIDGAAAGSYAGFCVSAAGDVNNDGFDDVMVGAPGAAGTAGHSFVVYGLKPTFAVTRIGSAADQTIRGGTKNDVLDGKGGNDTLIGDAGNDTVIGGLGRDVLTGRTGKDVFDFNTINEIGNSAASRDIITDFNSGNDTTFLDRIDLRTIDADSGTTGNQAFTFISSADFGSHARELRAFFSGSRTIIAGDTDGDGTGDFQIQLNGRVDLFANDFLL